MGNTALTALDLGAPQPTAIGGKLIGSSCVENRILAELLPQKGSDAAQLEFLAKKILPRHKVRIWLDMRLHTLPNVLLKML